jgi:hypothetical protein
MFEVNHEELTLLTNAGVLARLVVFWITGVPATNTSTLLPPDLDKEQKSANRCQP